MLRPNRAVEAKLTLIDWGADLLLNGVPAGRLADIEMLTSFADAYGLARLSVDRGLGPEAIYEPQPATVTLSGVRVGFPPG